MLKNVVIEAVDNCNLVVRADSERFGKNAIMYQDISLRLCCEYIARVTGRKDFKVKARAIICGPTLLAPNIPSLYVGPPTYKDSDGLTVTGVMDVVF